MAGDDEVDEMPALTWEMEGTASWALVLWICTLAFSLLHLEEVRLLFSCEAGSLGVGTVLVDGVNDKH
jgi:hypothetical protein